MSLSSVLEQFNHVREQKGDVVVDIHDLEPDDADEVFYFIDDALTETGYVKGRTSTIGFDTSSEDEHKTYLSAVVELLRDGYDSPRFTLNF